MSVLAPRPPVRPTRIRLAGARAALAAAALALASAAVSLFWTLGGTAGLDTVGGQVEELARSRSAASVALGAAVVALKVLAGILALALARPGRPPRGAVAAGAAGAALLVLWGGANVVVGGLVLADVVAAGADVDERALRWHVFFWDAWFLVWGVLLGAAVLVARRRAR